MENPNLNKIVQAKVEKVKERLEDLKAGLSDRWIATDSHLYQRVLYGLEDIDWLFSMTFENAVKTEKGHQTANETYLATIVETKEVKHPKTGEMVKLRVQKPQVRLATTKHTVVDYDMGHEYKYEIDRFPTNEELLAEQIAAESKKGIVYINGKFVQSPFISDGVNGASRVVVEPDVVATTPSSSDSSSYQITSAKFEGSSD